jgi:hypothetical protein
VSNVCPSNIRCFVLAWIALKKRKTWIPQFIHRFPASINQFRLWNNSNWIVLILHDSFEHNSSYFARNQYHNRWGLFDHRLLSHGKREYFEISSICVRCDTIFCIFIFKSGRCTVVKMGGFFYLFLFFTFCLWFSTKFWSAEKAQCFERI